MCWANTLKDSNIDIFKQLCSVQSEEFHFSVSFLSEFIRVLFTYAIALKKHKQTNKQKLNSMSPD